MGNISTAQHMTTHTVGETGARGPRLYCWRKCKGTGPGDREPSDLPCSAASSLLAIYTKDMLAKIWEAIYTTLSRNEEHLSLTCYYAVSSQMY